MEDAELLRTYVADGSEKAFAELVERHVRLVYSAALRQVGGDAHLAKDVAQSVFTDLARKAHALKDRKTLTGWLYTSTRFAATQVVRTERRRRAREQEAQFMNLHSLADGRPAWDQLRPVLDDVMGALDEIDREAILLRYFENLPFSEIGEKLSLNENTARMRVERALDKMHALLGRRGVMSTATALATILAEQAVAAVMPAGLVSDITGASLASAATAGAVLCIFWPWQKSRQSS